MTELDSSKMDVQQALRQSDKRFQTVLNSISESCYELDLEGRWLS
ncbi:MAG: hypothetical protein M0036_20810 [Desulfobacteraceae bacterium]|nr:hypothetical protein [Desulfobacteraceae bacterium]